ncbi:hypothetical protein DL96DRAFT_1550437 [Flagelloscypha sp. PMI_526]|nr:hypothetical protein DL96DRAFT_1550437 [Flagelloscypha sp. PMI_526]
MAFKFSLISYVLLLPIISIVNGFPETRRDGTIVLGPANGTVAGSAYFMSNDPTANYIITTDVHPDGTLSPRFAIPTGGKGGHGIQTVLGPNALFSDGSVRGHGTGTQAVITVNAGSNTMTLFRINTDSPSELVQIGEPVDTAGDFPTSVAYSRQGTTACVVNAGKRSGVACFAVNTTVGSTGFTPIPDTIRTVDLGQTTPPHGPPNTPGHIIFTEDDGQLVVAYRGVPETNTPGMLAIWNITAGTGALSTNFTRLLPPPGALEPSSITRLPNTPVFMVTDPFVGASIYEVETGITPKAVKAVPIAGQKFTSWSLFSMQTGNFYMSDIDANTVTELNVTFPALDTTIVKQYQLDSDAAPEDLTVSTIVNQDYLYVLEAGKLSVKSFIIKGAGQATPLEEVAYGPLAKKAGLNLDTNNVMGMSLIVTGP